MATVATIDNVSDGGTVDFQLSSTLHVNVRAIMESVVGRVSNDDIDQWFVNMSQANEGRGFYLELTAEGELVINPMVNMGSRFAEAESIADLLIWAREMGGGRVPSSRAIVRLPDGTRAEPDLSWLSPDQMEELPPISAGRPISVCPVFIGEILSRTDRLPDLQRKMERYIANGAAMAWLIDPYRRRVYVYFPGAEPLELDDPEVVSGEPVLPGFVFDVRRRIFDMHRDAER